MLRQEFLRNGTGKPGLGQGFKVKEFMKIDRFEDIEAWQRAHELTRKLYRPTKKPGFVMKSPRRSTVNREPDNLSSYMFEYIASRKRNSNRKIIERIMGMIWYSV